MSVLIFFIFLTLHQCRSSYYVFPTSLSKSCLTLGEHCNGCHSMGNDEYNTFWLEDYDANGCSRSTCCVKWVFNNNGGNSWKICAVRGGSEIQYGCLQWDADLGAGNEIESYERNAKLDENSNGDIFWFHGSGTYIYAADTCLDSGTCLSPHWHCDCRMEFDSTVESFKIYTSLPALSNAPSTSMQGREAKFDCSYRVFLHICRSSYGDAISRISTSEVDPIPDYNPYINNLYMIINKLQNEIGSILIVVGILSISIIIYGLYSLYNLCIYSRKENKTYRKVAQTDSET